MGVVPEDPLAGEVSHQDGVPGAQGTEAWAANHGGVRTASRSLCQAPSELTSPSTGNLRVGPARALPTQRPMTRPTVGFSRMFARPSHYEMRRLYSAWLPIQYQ
jgi:hypothetical protein